jgi:hypothetical protein
VKISQKCLVSQIFLGNLDKLFWVLIWPMTRLGKFLDHCVMSNAMKYNQRNYELWVLFQKVQSLCFWSTFMLLSHN